MITYTEIIIRQALAVMLESVVGLNRQRVNWAAGLRTHMLVCLGAALFMLVSAYGFSDILGREHIVLDPSRIAAQVVTGIGFLGAGTILVRRKMIHGINTAAGLWTVAAVGLAVGSGLYVAAVSATALILLILAGLKPMENRLFRKHLARTVNILVHRQKSSLAEIEAAVSKSNLTLVHLSIQRGQSSETDRIQLTFSKELNTSTLLALTDRLSKVEGVRKVGHPVAKSSNHASD